MGNLFRRTLKDGRAVGVHRNANIRKICGCSRRNWPKCAHPWHFNYQPAGGAEVRFSLDVETRTHVKTKGEAERLATDFKAKIDAGTFVRVKDRQKPAAGAALDGSKDVSLRTFADRYVEEASGRGKKTWTNDKHMLNRLCGFSRAGADGPLGDVRVSSITEDDVELFFAHLRSKGRAASTCNQYVQLLKSAFRWAAKKGYVAKNPIGDDSSLKRRKIAQRSRRLVPDILDDKGKLKEPGEERRLLDATAKNPGMQRLIIAALETGCRRGELLALTWADVNVERRELRIKGETAKDGEVRVLPISPRLAGVLEMAKLNPAGKEYKLTAFVFGEVGERILSTKRAWETAVLKAHGYVPVWGKGKLAAESRARLRDIDLHFHDLRHEAGSRLLEAGWPIHHVKEMLGHAKISQTDTYLNAGKMGLHDSMKRFDPARRNPVAIENTSDQPLDRNDDATETPKPLVN